MKTNVRIYECDGLITRSRAIAERFSNITGKKYEPFDIQESNNAELFYNEKKTVVVAINKNVNYRLGNKHMPMLSLDDIVVIRMALEHELKMTEEKLIDGNGIGKEYYTKHIRHIVNALNKLDNTSIIFER